MTGYEPVMSATVAFASGIPGFETCQRFVLVQVPDLEPALCLKGLDAPTPTFLVVDPRQVVPEYTGVLTDADRARLGAVGADACAWLAIVSFGDGPPVVNLRAPIVINPITMRGLQVVPTDSPWAVDVPWPAGAACSL